MVSPEATTWNRGSAGFTDAGSGGRTGTWTTGSTAGAGLPPSGFGLKKSSKTSAGSTGFGGAPPPLASLGGSGRSTRSGLAVVRRGRGRADLGLLGRRRGGPRVRVLRPRVERDHQDHDDDHDDHQHRQLLEVAHAPSLPAIRAGRPSRSTRARSCRTRRRRHRRHRAKVYASRLERQRPSATCGGTTSIGPRGTVLDPGAGRVRSGPSRRPGGRLPHGPPRDTAPPTPGIGPHTGGLKGGARATSATRGRCSRALRRRGGRRGAESCEDRCAGDAAKGPIPPFRRGAGPRSRARAAASAAPKRARTRVLGRVVHLSVTC